MSNGLTPMGKYLSRENSDKLKLWYKHKQNTAKTLEYPLFSVLTVDSEWMLKGYINSTSVMCFDNENDAIKYIENWNKKNKGYTRLLTPSN